MLANVGSRWDGGKLVFYSKKSGNTIATFDPDDEVLNIATLQIAGGDIAPAANQADSTAEDTAGLKTDFNALLDKLKTAGLMEADS